MTTLPIHETGQFKSPTMRDAPPAGETDALAQVASTLQFCKEQLQLCFEAIGCEYSSNHNTRSMMGIWNRIGDARAETEQALAGLEKLGYHPAPLPDPTLDAVEPELSERERKLAWAAHDAREFIKKHINRPPFDDHPNSRLAAALVNEIDQALAAYEREAGMGAGVGG